MMRVGLLATGFVCLAAALPQGAAAADPRAIIQARSCNSCHGPDGYSPGAIPSIRSMPQRSFIKAMQDFRSGRRTGTIMGRLAKAYSDADIQAMAEYFSSLK
jgi:cytochrome subunit of sulfide dehydrogenase